MILEWWYIIGSLYGVRLIALMQTSTQCLSLESNEGDDGIMIRLSSGRLVLRSIIAGNLTFYSGSLVGGFIAHYNIKS